MIVCNLKRLLSEKNMTQKELARLTGLDESAISLISRNTSDIINKQKAEIICEALGLTSLSELYEISVNKK